jgi:hypothetical protein
MLTSIPASVTRLLAGDACLNADRRPGMFLGATLLERSAVANNSTSRFTVAARNVLALGCLPGEAAGPPIWEMSVKTGRRSVITYLLSPLRRYAHEGIRER